MKVDEVLKCRVALNLLLAEDLRLAQKLQEDFPRISDAFQADIQELTALGFNKMQAQAVRSGKLLDRASEELERCHNKHFTVLVPEDERYPDLLRETFDPPGVIYCAGQADVLREPAVSIVGARRPTPYGRAVAERLAEDLASRGLVIVSGMARGIDSLAHWGALKGGKTVAVLGSGLEKIYPKENKKLFEKIADSGAVVSEFPLQSSPHGFHFPQRNRIISGLSLALLVVEATKRSGSLISARLALEQNREVMAVPGNVTSDLSRGTHWLIKTGAKLVETWEDVAEELPAHLGERLLSQSSRGEEKLPPLSLQEEKLLELLSPDSLTHVDELVSRSDLSVSEVLTALLSLELKGLIFQSPGKYFQRKW